MKLRTRRVEGRPRSEPETILVVEARDENALSIVDLLLDTAARRCSGSPDARRVAELCSTARDALQEAMIAAAFHNNPPKPEQLALPVDSAEPEAKPAEPAETKPETKPETKGRKPAGK